MSTAYDYKKYAILYVDDEEQALKYFRKGMDKDFRVLTATSVAEACTILEREAAAIGVVITDQRMPGQLGVELLKRITQQWPRIVRLLITAYSDIESAIESVNSGAIFKYITKPADFKQLRETLKGAMELFLSNGQRETLLNERMEVMQRMVVADRVRSLAMMAGGISHHLRNSMTALTCFLEETTPTKPGELPSGIGADPKFAEQLWSLAHKERERLLQIVHQVGQSVAERDFQIADEMDVADLLRGGIDAAAAELGGRPVATNPAAGLPKIKADAKAVTRLLRILVTYCARLSKPETALTLAATPTTLSGAAGVQLRVKAEGSDWSDEDVDSFFTPFAFPASDPSDLGLDLLSAFSVAYHHGGDIVVHKSGPAGPGFELRLPADPAEIRRPELQDGLMLKLLNGLPSPTKLPDGKAA
jgi:two-component system probable response regulator PhcQ